jgi:hypothetical protein
MKKSALLVSFAGLALSSAALAQSNPESLENYGKIKVMPNDSTFSGRVTTVVYGTPVDLRGYSDGGNPQLAGDDVDFAPGPAGNGSDGLGGPVSVQGGAYGIVVPAGATDNVTDTIFSFYDVFNGYTAGTFPGATLIAQRGLTGLVGTAGYITFFDTASPATIPDFATPVDIAVSAGTDAFVTITAVTAGTTNLHPTNWVVTGGPVLSVGSSNPVRWGDSNDDGLVQSTPAEINAGNTRYLYMGLQGDAPVTAPASEAWNAGGCLADGVSDRTAAIAASGVKWYNFCFTGTANADDDNLRFLDAYTSGATTGDANLAIYTADGALLAVAGGDRGAGTNPMVSTGVGRRTGDVDGEQFDGWAGDLDNSFGNTYFMAVFEQGGSAGAAFSVAGGLNAITAQTFISTNANAGTNAASIIPNINGHDYNFFGTGTSLTAGANPGTIQEALRDTVDAVRWSIFTTDTAVCAAGGSIVLDFVAQSAPISDVVAWVFDSNGNIVAFGDDGLGTPANKPDISFGAGGNSGDLPAGTYYLATALFDADNSDLSAVAGDDRFHVRSRSGSSLDVACDINYTPGTGTTCAGVTCDSIDFNNDTSFFDPQDIDAFLSVFSEGDCIPATATCNDIDFNNDSSVFDPCDIDSFLLQFQEGPCTLCGV